MVLLARRQQRLQLLDGRRGQADGRWRWRRRRDRAAAGVGIVLGTRQRPDDVEQFLLGQTDQRAAQQRAQSERVAPVGEHAGQRDEVLDFLAAEQSFAGLGRDRDAAPLQRLFIAPQIAAGRRKQRDVARPAGRASPFARSRIRLAADQPRAHLGDGFGFGVALLFGRALPFSSATATSRAATHRPRRDRDGTGRAR